MDLLSNINSQTPDPTSDQPMYNYSSETSSLPIKSKQGFVAQTIKHFLCFKEKHDSVETQNRISDNKMNRMILYLMPFTFQTFLITSSISTILLAYALPSFTHGYKHITNLPITFFLIYLSVLVFFVLLTLGTAWVMRSFRAQNNGEKDADIDQLEKDAVRINFTICLMTIFGVLVTVVCLVILFGCFVGFPQGQPVTDPQALTQNSKNPEDLESALKMIIKQAYAEDIAMVLTLAQAIMKRLDLPQVEIQPEFVLRNVLQPHAFFQASAIVRISKFLLVYFIALVNFNLWSTIYWLFHFRAYVISTISDLLENEDIGAAELEDMRRMIPVSAYGTPRTSGTETAAGIQSGIYGGISGFQSFAQNQGHHIVSRISMQSGQYNSNQNNNLNRQTRIVKTRQDYEVPEETVNHTSGIIEVPFIGKSTDNLSKRYT